MKIIWSNISWKAYAIFLYQIFEKKFWVSTYLNPEGNKIFQTLAEKHTQSIFYIEIFGKIILRQYLS